MTDYQKFDLAKELAQKVCDRFGLGVVESISRFEQGMINDVYSINGRYVLKVNSAHPDIPKLANEVSVYTALSNSDVPVPKVYGYDDSGELLKYPYMVMEQIRGETLKTIWAGLADEQKEAMAFEAGKCLGAIHTVGSEHVQIENANLEPNLKNSISSRIKAIGIKLRSSKVLEDHVIERLENYFQKSSCFDAEIKPSLLHGNYVFANIIAADNFIKAVVDWEWVSFGHDEEELAVTLYRGPTGLAGGMGERNSALFKEGYLSVHQVSDSFDNRYLPYALLYFLKVLPDIPKWTHRPDKQKEYVDATDALMCQIGL